LPHTELWSSVSKVKEAKDTMISGSWGSQLKMDYLALLLGDVLELNYKENGEDLGAPHFPRRGITQVECGYA